MMYVVMRSTHRAALAYLLLALGFIVTMDVYFQRRSHKDVVNLNRRNRNSNRSNLTILWYKNITMEFPAILIDLRFLDGLPEVQWDPDEISIKVAVHFGERTNIRREYLQRYDVVFYEQPPNKNYLLFHDEIPRIIPKISFTSYGNLSIPQDVKRFVKFWERSQFIRCIGLQVKRSSMKSYLPVEKTLQYMLLLQEYFISLEVYPFLFCGTLLGWFRECGIIPHTADVDFAVFIEEYRPAVLKELQSNRKLFLKEELGKPSDSFKFTLQPLNGSKPRMDILWLYTSENESWTGELKKDGTKYKYTYPSIRKICACDFLGYLFWVPCDPVAILIMEYGPKWYLDPTKSARNKSQLNVKMNGKFKANELKEVYKIYR